MKNAFEKYFLSLVFILISGFALLHANSFFDANYNFNEVEEIHLSENSNAEFQVHPAPLQNSDYEKVFIELTESEELEMLSKAAKKNLLLFAGSVFAVFFYVFLWETNLGKSLFSRFSTAPIRTGLSKRHIQFEVFRI